ncbi:unnamed protein product [Alopecurus aequalis]
MARFLFALLAVTVLAAGQLGHAAPSPAEVSRRPDDTNWLNKADPGTGNSFTDYTGSVKRVHAASGASADADARNPFQYYYTSSVKGVHAASGASADADARNPFHYYYTSSVNRLHAASGASDEASAATRAAGTATAVFFREEAVRVGESLPLRFPPGATAALGLLPRQVADSIPFSTRALPGVLAMLGVAPGSVAAAKMEDTLHACEAPTAVAGEAKFCATSLEALAERAMAALGTRDVRALASTLPSAGAPLQKYMVAAVRPVDGGCFVACHPEPYPYTVYRCHATGPARAYMVEMEGARAGGAAAVTVAVVCHTETSQWDPEHVSFKILGTKPGGAPVCHLMPYGHMIWAKNANHSPA